MDKFLNKLRSDDKKKQARNVFFLVLAAAVICELFVFNIKFWDSALSKEIDVSPTVVNGATDLGDNRYRIYKRHAYLEYENIDSKIKYVQISPESGYSTTVRFSATDEGNEYPLSVPARTVNTYVKPSQYIKLHFNGKVDMLHIDLEYSAGTVIDLRDIVINAKVPMMFSVVRVMLIVLIAMLLYLLRPNSSIYKYKTDLSRKKQRLVVIIAVILQISLFAGMSFINTDATKWDRTEVHHRQYYNLIEAFKQGKLSIADGSESLKSMENPYDFYARTENEVEFNWDNAYYEGKYYSYFGVLPAIILHLPYNLITGGELPNQVAVIILAAAVIIGIMVLLWEIIRKWFKNTPFILYLLLSCVFATTAGLFYAVYKPDFYMIPPLAGLALSLFGLSLWLNAEREDTTLSCKRIMWGALFIALTSMCRPQFLITLFFGVVVFRESVFKKRTLFSKSSVKETLALCLPIIAVAAVAMWYNYTRFGSPLDFGANYNLTTNDMTKRGIVLGRTGLGIFTYFLQPMHIDGQFPFINDFDPQTVYQGITITEKQIGGAFIIFPILIFAIVGLFKKDLFKNKSQYTLLYASIIMAFIVAVLDTQMAGILMRYLTDFVWLLMIAATITMMAMYENYAACGSELQIKRLRGVIIVLCAISLAVAFLSIFAHSKNAVWFSNSIAYSYIKHLIAFWL